MPRCSAPKARSTPAVVASAVIGTVSLGQFTLTGSSGNLLIVSPTQPPTVSLPVGTVLTASVPTSAQSSAASIFPSYITDSTIQMAINLVKYFNNLPIKLPPENAPPHTPVQRGAIQTFVYQSIAGTHGHEPLSVRSSAAHQPEPPAVAAGDPIADDPRLGSANLQGGGR